ncbi:MAG TPA: peptidoglycan DD-metalloendopeptidase family protein [Rhizomicrobium sp.]|nr:peptidoglycan DD-metalloendopeptidase family protein [Rhizomicrobium sp.]
MREKSVSNAQMAASLIERIWVWLHETFPERQIYIRSNGRVQFFTFGPSLQATLAGLALIFLGWVAFATVNVVFKDRIIIAKDHRFQEMQAAYENRLADLQISYDELNGALVSAEDKFKSTADDLQTKQNTIASFLNRKAQVEASALPAPGAPVMSNSPATASMDTGPASDSLEVPAPAGSNFGADTDSGSTLAVMPGPAAPQPRTAKPAHASLLQNGFERLRKIASALFVRTPKAAGSFAAAYAQHPGLRALTEQTSRVATLGTSESVMMAKTGEVLSGDVLALRDVVRRAGLNPDQVQNKMAAGGMGGPEIPLDYVQVNGIHDPAFNATYLKASAILGQLSDLSFEVQHIPLAVPVEGAGIGRTSGFGARLDPFTGHYAFHPGVDFAGPMGAPVHATASGLVTFAGNRGGYGNMVEIDNGLGIHTRYGHLSSITVRAGMQVERGAAIGRMGSTGRSTGPHVHYEIWYEDQVRNPTNFIEAGRHVL